MATRRGPDNSVRIAISMQEQTVVMVNVLWLLLTTSSTPTQNDLDSIVTSVGNAHHSNFSPFIAPGVTWFQAQGNLFLPGNGHLTSLVPLTGSGTGAATVNNYQGACCVVSWQINAYWRGGKPRTYLPFASSTDIQNAQELTPAAQASLKAAATLFRQTVDSISSAVVTTTQLGTVSFRSGNAERVPPLFFPYIGEKVHPRLGTQRRRLGKWRP